MLACMYVHHVVPCASGCQKRVLDLLELELWPVVSCHVVWRTDPEFSARAVNALTCWAIAPAPKPSLYITTSAALWDKVRWLWEIDLVKFSYSLLSGTKSTEQGLEMSRLPTFSLQEKSYIRGTSDFLGLGHFTTRYITQRKYPSHQGPSFQNDRDLIELVDPNWPDMGSSWLYSVPWGFRRLLNFAQVLIPASCVRLADLSLVSSSRHSDDYIRKLINTRYGGTQQQAWPLGGWTQEDQEFSLGLYILHTELKANLNCMRLYYKETNKNNSKQQQKLNKSIIPIPALYRLLNIGPACRLILI